MTLKFMSGGAWREATDIKFMSGGLWRRADQIKMMIGGAWRTVYVYDIVGPGAVGDPKAEWSNASGNACVVSWTQPTAPDLDFVDLYVNRNGSQNGPWTYLGRFTGSGARSYTDTSVTLSSYTLHGPNQASPIHYYKFLTFDVRGNMSPSDGADYLSGPNKNVVGSTGQGQSVVRGMVSSPYYVNPTDSRTWRPANGWRTDSVVQDATSAPERLVQGFFTGDATSQQNYGFYFYDAFQEGLNPTSAAVTLWRQNGGAGSGRAAHMRASVVTSGFVTNNTNPVNPANWTDAVLSAAYATPSNGGTRGGANNIPVSWVTGFSNGSYKSLLLYSNDPGPGNSSIGSPTYSVWSSTNEDIIYGTLKPGYMDIVHTG